VFLVIFNADIIRFAHHTTEEEEIPRLKGLGVAGLFPPGSPVDAGVKFVQNRFAERGKRSGLSL
jgi:methylmalonyl-CoA mutase cobalamin-binding subunit